MSFFLARMLRAQIVLFLVLISIVPVCYSQESTPPTAATKLEKARAIMEKGQDAQAVAEPDMVDASLKMFQGLALALAVLCIGVFIAKKFQKNTLMQGNKQIKILERVPLSPRTSLVLAEVNGKQVLISVGADQVSFYPNNMSEAFKSSLEEACDA